MLLTVYVRQNGEDTVDVEHRGTIAVRWENFSGMRVILNFGELELQNIDYKFARLIFKPDR